MVISYKPKRRVRVLSFWTRIRHGSRSGASGTKWHAWKRVSTRVQIYSDTKRSVAPCIYELQYSFVYYIQKASISTLGLDENGTKSSIWCTTHCVCARARCKSCTMRASVPQPPFVHTYYSSTLILHMESAKFQQNRSEGILGLHYYPISFARTIFCFTKRLLRACVFLDCSIRWRRTHWRTNKETSSKRAKRVCLSTKRAKTSTNVRVWVCVCVCVHQTSKTSANDCVCPPNKKTAPKLATLCRNQPQTSLDRARPNSCRLATPVVF